MLLQEVTKRALRTFSVELSHPDAHRLWFHHWFLTADQFLAEVEAEGLVATKETMRVLIADQARICPPPEAKEPSA